MLKVVSCEHDACMMHGWQDGTGRIGGTPVMCAWRAHSMGGDVILFSMSVAGLSRVKGVHPSALVLNATALRELQRCTTNGVADGSIPALSTGHAPPHYRHSSKCC